MGHFGIWIIYMFICRVYIYIYIYLICFCCDMIFYPQFSGVSGIWLAFHHDLSRHENSVVAGSGV